VTRERKTRYTIHLLREGATVEGVVRRADATPIAPAVALPYRAQAFLVANRSRPPAWVRTLAEHFALDELQNQSSSFVLFLEVGGRLFAFTAGYGHTVIDKRHIEYGFGVRVAASLVDEDSLTVWESRNVEGNTRQSRVQLAVGGDRTALGVDLDPAVVRSVAGSTSTADLLRVSGADSVTVKSPRSLDDLPTICQQLLAAFQSGVWRERFPELEALERLPRQSEKVDELNAAVADRLEARSSERLALAPLHVMGEDLDGYVLSGPGFDDVVLDEALSLNELYQCVPAGFDGMAKRLRLVPVDDSGGALDQAGVLRRYLVAEVEEGDDLFALTDGEWYRVNRDFLGDVARDLAGVDVTTELALPDWPREQHEAAYNEAVAEARGWRLLDKRNIHFPRHQKVEPCDLATADKDLIFVKLGSSSKSVSHLCKQAEVTAELLINDDHFRRSVCEEARFDEDDVRARRVRLVIAVASDKPGDLAEDLFLFSRISARGARRLIERNLGFRFGLAKIAYVKA
jgi:uncharacterized protein (TIGR04141 family)